MNKTKKAVSIEECRADLRNVFNTLSFADRKDGRAFEERGNFYIDKRECEREETISKLQQYFADKYIDGGQCRIESITLVWTVFHIEERK